jgi:hypothetical protein
VVVTTFSLWFKSRECSRNKSILKISMQIYSTLLFSITLSALLPCQHLQTVHVGRIHVSSKYTTVSSSYPVHHFLCPSQIVCPCATSSYFYFFFNLKPVFSNILLKNSLPPGKLTSAFKAADNVSQCWTSFSLHKSSE